MPLSPYVVLTIVAKSFADHERDQRALQHSQAVLDRTISGGAAVRPLVHPWYIEQPLLLAIVIIIIATVIGLLAGILVRLER
jgi:hypothetical protein